MASHKPLCFAASGEHSLRFYLVRVYISRPVSSSRCWKGSARSSAISSHHPSLETGKRRQEPLAVIGMGCRLPGGINSPATYWNALLSGLDAIREVPEDRWKHAQFHDPN